MDLNPSSFDPMADFLREMHTLIVLGGILAIPLGWILACFALWRPLPHLFTILSRWFVGINAAISVVLLMVVTTPIGGLGVDETEIGWLAASVSGLLAWIVVGRRSRALEPVPSLL